MELIRRVAGWTPGSLLAALLGAAAISALFIASGILVTVIADTGIYPEPSFIFGYLFASVIVFLFVLAELVVFILLPTLLLKRFQARRWTAAIAVLWGGASGVLMMLTLNGGMERFVTRPDDMAYLFLLGAVPGLVWWTLARRVLRADFVLIEDA